MLKVSNKHNTIHFTIILNALTLLYLCSIAWVNFHPSLWYSMDMYTYAYEGRLMSESHSFFPPGWIFSNQYHIVSSPNLSALFYFLCHDAILAMACASTLNTLLIIATFFWCFHGAMGIWGLSSGLLCILGGIIFGNDAAEYVSGLQVLHTMASFYSCYMIGILLSLGVWLRLNDGKRVSPIIFILVYAVNFALGMQSLREILILNIPIIVIESYSWVSDFVKNKKDFRQALRSPSLRFVFFLLLAEMWGDFFMSTLNVPTNPNISGISLNLSLSSLADNFWSSTKNLLRISGISLAADGVKNVPLSICALFIASVVLWSLLHIIRSKDSSLTAKAILFSFVSILCVYGVGIFFMRTRDIYYFVYWLLSALCVAYVIEKIDIKYSKVAIMMLAVISSLNYLYNFFPDYKSYKQYANSLSVFTDSLVDKGIEVIYVDANPIFAAASHDKIVSQSFWLNIGAENNYLLSFSPSDKNVEIYDDNHYEKSLICFSNYYLNSLSTDFPEYKEKLLSHLSFYDEFEMGDNLFLLFTSNERLIAPYEQY